MSSSGVSQFSGYSASLVLTLPATVRRMIRRKCAAETANWYLSLPLRTWKNVRRESSLLAGQTNTMAAACRGLFASVKTKIIRQEVEIQLFLIRAFMEEGRRLLYPRCLATCTISVIKPAILIRWQENYAT